jgi:hypothetical protein
VKMGFALSLVFADSLGLRFSPVGELLSFASPKESNPRRGDTKGASLRAPVLGEALAIRVSGTGGCPPSALPIWRVRAGKKRNRVRVPQHGAFCAPCQGELVERPPVRAKSGTRRAAMWGRLSLVTFFGEAKKVTRPKAKSEAIAHPKLKAKKV